MWIYQLFLIALLLDKLSAQDSLAPVYTPDSEMIKQDQFEKAKSGDNLEMAEIMLSPTVSPPPTNQTSPKANSSSAGKQRKRKYQNNKQYRPNVIAEKQPNQMDTLALWANTLKKSQLNDLQNSLLIQMAAKKLAAQAVGSDQHEATVDKYSALLPALTNNDLPYHVAPIYTVNPPVSQPVGQPANGDQAAAVQLYLKQLAQLAALRKQSPERSERSQEKPRLQKRVSNQPNPSTSLASNLYLNQLMAMQSQPQPIYSFFPNQPAVSQSAPLYLALQPSFPASPSANNQRENGQVNSLIETGDKIYAKIKQWSTDVFNPKSSLNRQINEVLGVVSDVALVTLIGVPVISLLTLGVSSLMTPLSQLSNRKLVDRTKSAASKQKTKEEKKDKDEKTAKSDTHISQKNTKMLDKRSRLVSLMERAGDEFTHFKNIVEIAKNFELAFKKYNVDSRECKYRILCEVGSGSGPNETGSDQAGSFLANNQLREGRALRRQARSVGNRVSSFVSNEPTGNQLKTIDCEQQSNCSRSTNQTGSTSAGGNLPTQPPAKESTPAKESAPATTFLQNQLKHFERMANQRGGAVRNLIRSFNLDKFINENREGFIGFASTIDQLLNRAHRANFFTYLLNEEQFNQAFRSDGRLFKTIAERSKQLQDKLRDFLDNLTLFQQVVSKESAVLDGKASKYKMFNAYNLRSKRTANLNGNVNNNLANETAGHLETGEDDTNLDVSGLRSVLVELVHQLKFEQNQDNLILPLSKIWLSPYLSAFEFGSRHTAGQCKSRYFKCTTNFLGLNSNNGLARRLDLEISEISNNHLLKQAVKKKPDQPATTTKPN